MSWVLTALTSVWSFFTKWIGYFFVWRATRKAAKYERAQDNIDALKDTVKTIDRVERDGDFRDWLRNRSRPD